MNENKPLTVADLRAVLADLPDNLPVVMQQRDDWYVYQARVGSFEATEYPEEDVVGTGVLVTREGLVLSN